MDKERKEIKRRINRTTRQIKLLKRDVALLVQGPQGGTARVSILYPAGEIKQNELTAQEIRQRLVTLRRQRKILNFAYECYDAIKAGLSVDSDRKVTTHVIDRFIDFCERHWPDFRRAVVAASDLNSNNGDDTDLIFDFTDEVCDDAATKETKEPAQLFRY